MHTVRAEGRGVRTRMDYIPNRRIDVPSDKIIVPCCGVRALVFFFLVFSSSSSSAFGSTYSILARAKLSGRYSVAGVKMIH